MGVPDHTWVTPLRLLMSNLSLFMHELAQQNFPSASLVFVLLCFLTVSLDFRTET